MSAAFDDSLEMGIVGTTAGTLWYINWVESTSIRLISGHKNKVREAEPALRFAVASGYLSATEEKIQMVGEKVFYDNLECTLPSPTFGVRFTVHSAWSCLWGRVYSFP